MGRTQRVVEISALQQGQLDLQPSNTWKMRLGLIKSGLPKWRTAVSSGTAQLNATNLEAAIVPACSAPLFDACSMERMCAGELGREVAGAQGFEADDAHTP